MKKFIVAGGGHGGICVAAFLAKAGHDVTVYEQNLRENMGYDWTDIFAPDALKEAGIPMPSEDKFEYKTDMTFYAPSERTAVKQDVPLDKREIKMERRDIYGMIIENAENSGVKFEYGHKVLSPLTAGDRVVGIITDKGDFYADMVIDACGCESPVRAGLPECCGIQKHTEMFEKFYVYRGFFNKTDVPAHDKYKVCLLPEGKLGVGWVATEEEYTDLLIGRFEPFDMDEVNRTAEAFRKKNPSLGTRLMRGGQFVQIPVRQPLGIMVADGYAAIGDSAFMTVPVIGSGLANTFKASHMLANTILNDKTETYSAETLWDYQVEYYKKLGGGLAPLAAVKLLLTRLAPDELDFLFDNKILTSKELTITAESVDIVSMIHPSLDLLGRGAKLLKDRKLVLKLIKTVGDVAKVMALCAAMPKKYSRSNVTKWAKDYNSVFKA